MNIIKKLFLFLTNKNYREKHLSFYALKRLKRYTPAEINVFEYPIRIVDSASFLFQYNEIFIRKIYAFNSNAVAPFIIDGGSNIGLAIIYWKQLFPNSEIIGFEPDKYIFEALDFNIKSLKFKDVSVINKGLWNDDTELFFDSDGSDGGRISNKTSNTKIEVTGLKKYLNRKIDFLKLDIEGAEVVVLSDCANHLQNVANLFIEYHSFENQLQQLDKLLKILTESGFRYYIQSIGVNSLHPFISINKYLGMDIQLNIYAYR